MGHQAGAVEKLTMWSNLTKAEVLLEDRTAGLQHPDLDARPAEGFGAGSRPDDRAVQAVACGSVDAIDTAIEED